jgi:hypothetical protein
MACSSHSTLDPCWQQWAGSMTGSLNVQLLFRGRVQRGFPTSRSNVPTHQISLSIDKGSLRRADGAHHSRVRIRVSASRAGLPAIEPRPPRCSYPTEIHPLLLSTLFLDARRCRAVARRRSRADQWRAAARGDRTRGGGGGRAGPAGRRVPVGALGGTRATGPWQANGTRIMMAAR